MTVTPQQIIDGMAEKNRLLTDKNDESEALSEKMADAERSYNKALAKRMIALKIEGQNITLIEKIAKGDDTVADLKYASDVATGVYKVSLSRIKSITIAIDTYRSLLAWQKAEMLRSE